MRVHELLTLSRPVLMALYTNGVELSIIGYTEMYAEYLDMVKRNYKKAYIYEMLAQKYDISKRSVQRRIAEFEKEITPNNIKRA